MHIHKSLTTDPLYKESQTENNGLALIDETMLKIYCPGVSTGGFAEISMALENPNRKIVATTLDEQGILESVKLVQKYSVASQIELKLEDVSKPLPYANESFDFVYARLVLHYLSNADLHSALSELYRILQPGHILYVVVRSFDWESDTPDTSTDPQTGMTRYPEYDTNGVVTKFVSRRLHTSESISEHILKAGFRINSIQTLEETIYGGYLRIRPNKKPSTLIEIIAEK